MFRSNRNSLPKGLRRLSSAKAADAEDSLLKESGGEDVYTWKQCRAFVLHSLQGDYALSIEERTRLTNSLQALVEGREAEVGPFLAQHISQQLIPTAAAFLAAKVKKAGDRNERLLELWRPLFLQRLPSLQPILAPLTALPSLDFNPRREFLAAFRNQVVLDCVDLDSVEEMWEDAEWWRMLATLEMLARDGSERDGRLAELAHPHRDSPPPPRPTQLFPSAASPPKATTPPKVALLRSPGAKTVRWEVWEEAEEPIRRHSVMPALPVH